MDLTTVKIYKSTWAKALSLPSGSTEVFDRGYTAYQWYQSLTDRNITFVTRLKRNAVYELLDIRRGKMAPWVVGDQRIRLKNMKTDLRLVDYVDPETANSITSSPIHLSSRL